MTDKLRRYMNENKYLIENDDLRSLHKLCPQGLKKELCLMLLECSDVDTSLIYKNEITAYANELVQSYVPHSEVCHIGTVSYGGMPNDPRRGALEYIVILDGVPFEGSYEYSVTNPDVKTYKDIIDVCIEDFCSHLERQHDA